MKKSTILPLIILLSVILTAFYTPDNGFNKLWKKVEYYQKKGLPKSAIKVVDEIYTVAKKEHNNPQVIKALIFKAGLVSSHEEDYLIKSINTFEQEIEDADSPEKQILYSLTGELYQQYFSNNRYKILQREQLAVPGNDIETWDAVQFNKAISSYYLQSLEPEELLQNIALDQYDAILKLADSSAVNYRPTLYDLLAERAINYFLTGDYKTFHFDRASVAESDSLLVPAHQFVKLKLPTTTNADRILTLYQHLIKLHLKDANPVAFIDFELGRINFIASHFTVKTQVQRTLLGNLYQQYKDDDVSVRIAFRLAENYKLGKTAILPRVFNAQLPEYSLVKARDLCNEAVELHPNAPFANNCRNMVTRLEQPSFAVETEKQILPGKPFLAKVSFKNVTHLWFKIVKVDSKEVWLDAHNSIRDWEKKSKYLSAPGIRSWEVNLPDAKDLQQHSTEIKMDGLPLGTYFIYASLDKSFVESEYVGTTVTTVTRLSFITKPEENGTGILVQNRETGVGISGVSGDLFYFDYQRGNRKIKKAGSFVTGNDGFTKTMSSGSNYGSVVRLINEGDTLYEPTYLSYYRKDDAKPTTKIHLFTDRAIYRPGQTVYYKGIVVQKEGDRFTVLNNFKTEVSLKNSNGKTVSTQEVVSNEFGSFSGSFVIPTGTLNGNWRLRAPKGSVNFSVEEYKRPSFLVEFDTVAGSWKYNDNITITGKANYYNGSPVSGASVTYRVTRQNYYPVPFYWYSPMLSQEIDITNGNVKLDENGNFSITFKAVPDDVNKASQFTVYADVTDITGEVHSGNTVVKVSNRPLWVAIGSDENLDKDGSPEIKLAATNTMGNPLSVSGQLKVYALQQPDKVFINRLWSEPDTFTMDREVYEKFFPQIAFRNENNKEQWPAELVMVKNLSWTGDTSLPASLVQSLKKGYYKFVFTANGTLVESVSDSVTTLVYSSKSKRPAVKKDFWMHLSKEVAEPGETVDLMLASATKNTRVYYELSFKNNVIEKRWIKLNRKQVVIPINIKEAWRGGVRINLVMVKNNRRQVVNQRIRVPFTNKKLKIQLQTHRDHLTPGKKETWSVKISGYKGDKVAAELLAAMYDQSLDQIKEHSWHFDLFHQLNGGNGWLGQPFQLSGFDNLHNKQPEYLTEYTISYPAINWFGMRFFNDKYYVQGRVAGIAPAHKSEEVDVMMVVDDDMDMEMDNAQMDEQSIKTPPSPLEKTTTGQPSIIRTDFRETAFFYPQLHTDTTGSVIFSFTTPDALTQWKLMMLAHTTDLSSDIETLSFKAYKELMIMPNAPRFVRQGDRLVFSARVTNFSDKEQTVRVNLNFFNPVTNKKLNLFLTRMATGKKLKLKVGESAKVSWMIAIPDDINLMAYRIEAASESFSDGEERTIPILSNRVLVTETMPMYVNAKGHKKYQFSKLLNQDKLASVSTLKNFRYTLEFTSNPAWYAIQALPYMSEPTYKSASNLYRAWFANALAGWIINSTPNIKAVFESWKINSPDAFLSALQKNQELKNTVLEETPWVLEAENEGEQKRRIALLFDLNNLKSQQEVTLNRLQQLQRGSGAWPWFRGMGDDRYTTQKIVLGMAKLLDKGIITVDEPGVKNMLRKAVSYLDREVVKDYDLLKKQPNVKMNRQHISSFQIQYLYARTLLKNRFPLNKKTKKVFDYYLDQAKTYWLKENNYLQAMIAVVMFENSYRNEAEAILRSLEERSLYSDEMGMYWRAERGWSWYQAPVETQAMIIEAFSRLNYNPQNIDKMKVWLLKQKQTQRWPTSSATAEAVSALLMTGNSSLLAESKPVSIKLGGKSLNMDNNQQEAGTGYFKKSWPGCEVQSSMGNIEVSNPNGHITWGAAYWQYFENIDKVTASRSPLNVEKNLYVETLTDNGPVLEAAAGKKLKVGDKIVVRLIIRTDRDMEFVQLKDVRATGMEVTQQLSGYTYKGGLGFYRNNKDASTGFFFRYLNKGTYVLEYPVHLTQQGVFPVGLATIQCLYAPEFAAHSQGETIKVEE